MEKDIELMAIEYLDPTGTIIFNQYTDTELGRDVQAGERIWCTEKRAKKLIELGVTKLAQIKKKK